MTKYQWGLILSILLLLMLPPVASAQDDSDGAPVMINLAFEYAPECADFIFGEDLPDDCELPEGLLAGLGFMDTFTIPTACEGFSLDVELPEGCELPPAFLTAQQVVTFLELDALHEQCQLYDPGEPLPNDCELPDGFPMRDEASTLGNLWDLMPLCEDTIQAGDWDTCGVFLDHSFGDMTPFGGGDFELPKACEGFVPNEQLPEGCELPFDAGNLPPECEGFIPGEYIPEGCELPFGNGRPR